MKLRAKLLSAFAGVACMSLVVGGFADEVNKVLSIEAESIEPPPKIGMSIQTDFIQGMGHVEEGFVVILNVRELLTAEDLGCLESAVEAETEA